MKLVDSWLSHTRLDNLPENTWPAKQRISFENHRKPTSVKVSTINFKSGSICLTRPKRYPMTAQFFRTFSGNGNMSTEFDLSVGGRGGS